MENTIKSTQLKVIVPAYRMHSQLFNNVVADISLIDAKKRIHGSTNHVLWMVGNLVNCRYWLANLLGAPDKDPYDHFFADAKALDETYDYPEITTLKNEWHHISPILFSKLCSLTDEALLKPLSLGMDIPFIEENQLNAIGMSIGREDYLFGQLGLMRRALGYKAMQYGIDEKIKY